MIKDILYNEFFEEASIGRIDCGFLYNVLFETNLPNKRYTSNIENNLLQIPSLYISNPDEFEHLVEQYVNIAYDFYDKDYYEYKHDYIKAIITYLFVNMTVEDFLNPNNYIRKRIAFFQDNLKLDINEPFHFGSSNYIGDISATILEEPIYEETPYSLNFRTETHEFPTIRFGIQANTVYIYAIQNRRNNIVDKKVNRTLYKINDNFDTTNESFDNINDYENLTGVTNSSVAAATMALSFFLKNGYTDIRMPSFLPIRFNAKEMARDRKLQKLIDDPNYDKLVDDSINDNMEIQRNISDKFIRTFRRIENHFGNININSYPFDVDSCLHLTIDGEVCCNNALLEDLFTCGYETKRK